MLLLCAAQGDEKTQAVGSELSERLGARLNMEPENQTIYEKEKPVLYTATGEEIVLKKPLGFARHPACSQPQQKGKPKK